MSFGWLGTFRQGSWQAFRKFVLEERRDAFARLRTIDAELTRIGHVRVLYASVEGEVREQRVGFTVAPRSSLGKLVQAYTAMGGNPLDISMFLTPDSVSLLEPNNPDSEIQTQPHGGVVSPRSAAYTTGQIYEGGYLALAKYVPARVGGRVDLEDSKFAIRVDVARRWVNSSIRYKRDDLEARIIKLCDLREQLIHEKEQIQAALAGFSDTTPELDEDLFDPDLTVSGVVASIDAVFYPQSEDGTPDFTQENTEALGHYPYLLSDILPDEENTAL